MFLLKAKSSKVSSRDQIKSLVIHHYLRLKIQRKYFKILQILQKTLNIPVILYDP
jgi:hypothetical protein